MDSLKRYRKNSTASGGGSDAGTGASNTVSSAASLSSTAVQTPILGQPSPLLGSGGANGPASAITGGSGALTVNNLAFAQQQQQQQHQQQQQQQGGNTGDMNSSNGSSFSDNVQFETSKSVPIPALRSNNVTFAPTTSAAAAAAASARNKISPAGLPSGTSPTTSYVVSDISRRSSATAAASSVLGKCGGALVRRTTGNGSLLTCLLFLISWLSHSPTANAATAAAASAGCSWSTHLRN